MNGFNTQGAGRLLDRISLDRSIQVGKAPRRLVERQGKRLERLTFTCTTCGEPAVSVKPGSSPLIAHGITLSRGEPSEAWCMRHLLFQFGPRQGALFGETA